MAGTSTHSIAAITSTNGVIVVTMQADMDAASFESMQKAVLARVARTTTTALVLDFSAVDVMNLTEFNRTRRFLSAVRLLGVEAAVVSLSAGIVLYLAEVQAETDGISYYNGLDEALQRYGRG